MSFADNFDRIYYQTEDKVGAILKTKEVIAIPDELKNLVGNHIFRQGKIYKKIQKYTIRIKYNSFFFV